MTVGSNTQSTAILLNYFAYFAELKGRALQRVRWDVTCYLGDQNSPFEFNKLSVSSLYFFLTQGTFLVGQPSPQTSGKQLTTGSVVQGTLGVSTSSAQGQQTLKVISGQKTTLFTQVNMPMHTPQIWGDCGIYLHIYMQFLSLHKEIKVT